MNSAFSNPKTKNNLLALEDGKASPTEWAPEVLEKVDEALNLAGQAKRATAVALGKDVKNSALWSSLRTQLESSWTDLAPLVGQLERAKLFKNLDLAEVRELLQTTSVALMATQDLLKGLNALS